MWLTLDQYLKKINYDSKKYFDLDENILELTADTIPLDFNSIFNNNNKILKFEIGFGNGDSLIKLALKNPGINYFGIDRKMDRIRITLRKLRKRNKIPNLVIARCGTDYLEEMIKPDTFDEIIMNFPDPWPKKKHHKNRTVNERFLKILYNLLKGNGVFRFSSDHTGYSFEVIDMLLRSELFKNLYHPAHYLTGTNNRIMTQFEKHKSREGYTIHHLKFGKV